MISIFRKEMRQWHFVLWAVFASMAISGLGLIFWRGQSEDGAVASVDGREVTTKDLKRSIQQMQQQFSMISSMYGVSLDLILKTFLGGQDVQTLALDNAIKDVLVSKIEHELDVRISQDFFKDELVRSLPQGIADQQGRVNMDVYENYLQRLSITPAEFEFSKEAEFKREAVNRVIGVATYTPHFSTDYQTSQDAAKKSFTIVKFDFGHFKEKKSDLNGDKLKHFYNENKERFRVPERKQARVVQVSTKTYENSVVIDEQSIQSFYDKNKANRYRIAPKLRVRHIFLTGTSPEVLKKAEGILAEVKKDQSSFASLAKKHSDNKDTASKGGLTEYFSRQGTFDVAFEKEAFKLMKKGEIAPLVRTAKGLEIIMLDDRINATEKPLSEVRSEIIASLRSRKAMNNLKSDLEALMHNSKTNNKAFDQFITKNNLKSNLSDFFTASSDAKVDGYDGKLVGRLFSKANYKGMGYFMHADEYVLYQAVATEKSYIRELADIEERVTEDYLAQKATDSLKHFVKSAKSDILSGKTSLVSYKNKGFSLVETGNIERGAVVSALKDVKGLVDRAFVLDDKNQVLEFRHKQDIYLIQLENTILDATGKDAQVAKQGSTRSSSGAVVNGFIASLQRNAKITVNEILMNAYKSL
jgi:peptidyl-prolyl cis-trans isomerase D